MKSDSYSRYLRSEMYKDYLNGSKKKVMNFNLINNMIDITTIYINYIKELNCIINTKILRFTLKF